MAHDQRSTYTLLCVKILPAINQDPFSIHRTVVYIPLLPCSQSVMCVISRGSEWPAAHLTITYTRLVIGVHLSGTIYRGYSLYNVNALTPNALHPMIYNPCYLFTDMLSSPQPSISTATQVCLSLKPQLNQLHVA